MHEVNAHREAVILTGPETQPPPGERLNISELVKEAQIRAAERTKKTALLLGYTETQATIVEQLKAMEPQFIQQWGVSKILNIKAQDMRGENYDLSPAIEEGIRLHIRSDEGEDAQVLNVDIWYNIGDDLYNVAFWKKTAPVEFEEVKRLQGVFFDNLPEQIAEEVYRHVGGGPL